ncbi:MAG: hypothetical protein ACKVOM_02305 [Ferruginibacter sp.]
MPDIFYPSVDFSFIERHLKDTEKFEGYFSVGQTKTFVLKGNQAIHKRTIRIRELSPGKVCYEQATGLAARFRFMSELLAWFETNTKSKEGGYVEP